MTTFRLKIPTVDIEVSARPSVLNDPANYPGIVLHQPYAGLIRLAGMGLPGKTIETRKTRITYRGPLVIIASKRVPVDYETARARERLRDRLGRDHLTEEESVALWHFGGRAVALFDVNDCRALVPEDEPEAFFYEPARWAWCSSRIRPLRPFPVQGHQGFVRVPRAQVDAALIGGHGP